MTIYKCPRCGRVFDDPETITWYEDMPWVPGGAREYFEECRCPYCGEQNIEEGRPCYGCGSFSDLGVCDSCSGIFQKWAQQLAEEIGTDDDSLAELARIEWGFI